MEKQNNLIRVFTGSEISVILLKGELEENGIASLIRNDYQSGASAGFYGGSASGIDLFIQESDLKTAEPIIEEFILNNAE